jgi:hypothetical protein
MLPPGDSGSAGGTLSGHLEIHGLNDVPQALIVSNDPMGETMFLVAPGRLKSIVRPGSPCPEGSRYGAVIYMPEAMNSRGQAVWSGTVESGETWTFFYDARTGRTAVVQRPGTPAPGGGMFVPGERCCPDINNRGEIAFHAYVADPQTGAPVPGVFAHFAEETVLVAREGTPAPNGARFSAAEFASINDAGVVVFHGTVAGRDELGVYRWRHGKLTAVAPPGTSLSDGRRLEHAFYPQIDRIGRVVFVGQTRRGAGLYRWVEGAIHPVVEPGDELAGIGPVEAIEFNGRRPFDLNPAGAVAFIGHGSTRDGVFAWERGKVKLVALSGATLPGVGVAEEVGATSGQMAGSGVPGGPYGYAPPARAGGAGTYPLGPYGPYGPPGGAYGYYDRSFGIGLSEAGKVVFLATTQGGPCLILATPKPAPGRI